MINSTTINSLIDDGHQPFLYGSRSKRCAFTKVDQPLVQDSDYDYALPYSWESCNYFEKRFGRIADCYDIHSKTVESYKDRWTERVYNIPSENLQVSFKKDFHRFVSAWNSITVEFYWKYLNKRSPTYIGREGVTEFMNILYDKDDYLW